jgi:hypothetical protein
MARRVISAIGLLCLVALTGCGGGSSSGGGQLAGNYVGTARYSVSGAGGSFADAAPAVLVVNGAGQVAFASLEGGASSCSGVPPVFLEGRHFSYSIRYSCRFPDIGLCAIVENGSGSIRGGNAFAEANGAISCAAGTVSFVAEFSGARQLAAAEKTRSKRRDLARTIERAM